VAVMLLAVEWIKKTDDTNNKNIINEGAYSPFFYFIIGTRPNHEILNFRKINCNE
jgi:hypothetical protein